MNLYQDFLQGKFSFLFSVQIPVVVLVIVCALTLLAIVLISVYIKSNSQKIKYYSIVFLVSYLTLLLLHTIVYRQPKEEAQFEIIPFWSYMKIAEGRTVYLVENLLNIVLFVPLGVFLGSLLGSKSSKRVVVYGSLVSILIEFAQLITHRGLWEFDDVFHNCIGCIIGYALYLIFRKAFYWFKA